MGRAFEYRKATKLKRWGHMAKTFTKIGKQIAVAVKAGGPEPENNPALRAIIATAKRENMPKDNIERAIKNAMGKDQSEYKTMTYEGYGPHGVAIFVDTLTDNPTRTVGDVRSVFNKFNGNLGTMGSLAYLFDHKCVFSFKKKDGIDMDEMILDLIDYGVEDEYDEDEEEPIREIQPGREYEVLGSAKLDDVNEALGTKLESEDYDSVGGYIIEQLDCLPREGESVTLEDGMHLVVDELDKNRIELVHIWLPEHKENPEAADA